MDERLHSMFQNEMSSQVRPSLGGLAEEVLSKGRRARRARAARVASAAFVVIGVAVAVPTLALGHNAATHPSAAAKSGHSGRPATKQGTQSAPSGGASAATGAQLLTTTSSPSDYIPQPPGPKARTTAAAILDELLKLLPPGTTSDYALYRDQYAKGLYQTGAQAVLNGARGLGLVRIFVFNEPPAGRPHLSHLVKGGLAQGTLGSRCPSRKRMAASPSTSELSASHSTARQHARASRKACHAGSSSGYSWWSSSLNRRKAPLPWMARASLLPAWSSLTCSAKSAMSWYQTYDGSGWIQIKSSSSRSTGVWPSMPVSDVQTTTSPVSGLISHRCS